MIESNWECIEPFGTAFEENANTDFCMADASIGMGTDVNDVLDVMEHPIDLTREVGDDDLSDGNVPDPGCSNYDNDIEGGLETQEMILRDTDEIPSDTSSIHVADDEASSGGDGVSFCGRRDDILKEMRQAQSDVNYYTNEVARLTKEQNEGWIVDSILFDRKSALTSAQNKLRDLERELSSVRD